MCLLVGRPYPLPFPVRVLVSGHHVPHLRHFVPDLILSVQIQFEHELCEHTMYARPHDGVIVPDAVALWEVVTSKQEGVGQSTDHELALVAFRDVGPGSVCPAG